MSILDWFRKKKDKPSVSEPEKAATEPEKAEIETPAPGISDEVIPDPDMSDEVIPDPDMSDEDAPSLIMSSDGSLSISISKDSIPYDMTKSEISGPDSITNEEITKGTPLLGTYKVISDAIRGGMGSVWKVHHRSWNIDLAMKRPQPKFFAEGSEKRKENFIRECESWIKLGLHPNIVSCYYVREIGGVPTIFFDLLENGSLKNRIEDGSLYEGTEEEVRARLMDIAIQFCRGLHYAHESKDHLIHQDVKPDNLLLTDHWEAKVADFGLAKARTQLKADAESGRDGSDEDRKVTEYALAGVTHVAPTGGYTPAYCSREQYFGETLTRRTDIYSWAVSVLEMYLGQRPWTDGREAGEKCAAYFAQSRVFMPEHLKDLLAKCLRGNAEERPHDFASVEAALKEIYREVIGSDYPREESEAAADTADSLNNRALSFLDLGKDDEARQLWDQALEKTPDHLTSLYNQGVDQWRDGLTDYEEVVRRCETAKIEKDETELAAHWRESLEREQEDSAPRLLLLGAYEKARYVFSRGDTPIRIDSDFRQHALSCAVVSSDGNRIYGAVANAVGCWDAQTLDEQYFDTEDREPAHDFISELAVSGDDRFLVGISGFKTVWAADAATGQTLRYLFRDPRPKRAAAPRKPGEPFTASDVPAPQFEVRSICILPDCRHLIVSMYMLRNGRLHVMDLETGQEQRRLTIPAGWIARHLCASPDGNTLYLAIEGGIGTLDLQSGRFEQHLMDLKGKRWTSFRITGDGNWIYGTREASDGALFRCKTADMKCESVELPYKSYAPVWVNRDGSLVITASQDYLVRLWDVKTCRLRRSFWADTAHYQKGMGGFRNIDALDDLSLIVGGSGDRTLQIWNGTAPVRQAEWELNKAKSYVLQVSIQNELTAKETEIQEEISKGSITQAICLLEEAEEHYDPHYFLPLRRKLMEVCRRERLESVLEASHFPINSPLGLCADPGGGVFAVLPNTDGQQSVEIMDESGMKVKTFVLPDSVRFNKYAIENMRFSPSGRFFAAGKDPVVLWSPDLKGTAVFKGNKVDGVNYMAFSPDDKWLVIHRYRDIIRISALDGEIERRIEPEEGQTLCAVLDDRRLVFSDQEGRMHVYRMVKDRLDLIKSFTAVPPNEYDHHYIMHTVLSPDTKRLYLSSWMGVSVWDTDTWEKIDLYDADEIDPVSFGYWNFDSFAVSPDGSLLAAGTNSVRIWSTTERKLVWEGPGIKPKDFAFAPDLSALYVSETRNAYLNEGVVYVLILRHKLRCPDP